MHVETRILLNVNTKLNDKFFDQLLSDDLRLYRLYTVSYSKYHLMLILFYLAQQAHKKIMP